jgi:hypothetical protein
MIPLPVRRKTRGIEKSKTSTALQPRGTSCHADRFTRLKTLEVDSNFREWGCDDEASGRVVEGAVGGLLRQNQKCAVALAERRFGANGKSAKKRWFFACRCTATVLETARAFGAFFNKTFGDDDAVSVRCARPCEAVRDDCGHG